MADYLDGKPAERVTFERYLTELGLVRTSVARILGPEVISGVAVTGSDPFIHEGTDLTLLFQVTHPEAFDLALTGMLSRRGEGHGAITASSFVHEGVTVNVARSADGRVRRHRANVGGVEIVSSSPGAIRRVISAALGRGKRLSDEPDFRYLKRRDAKDPDDVMAFMGDAFVARVASPAVRIAQSRRELALAELSAPVYASLLYGIVNGRPPSGRAELERQGFLDAGALVHFDGAPITVAGLEARSRYGTVTALEPLIDGPEVTTLTDAELDGYLAFARFYEEDWSIYVDPVMLRAAQGKGGEWNLSLREVPILPRTARPLLELMGTARIAAAPLDSGLRFAFAFGEGSFRREVLELGPRDPRMTAWPGHAIALGVEDGDELVRVAKALLSEGAGDPDPAPENDDINDGREEVVEAFRDLPLYAKLELDDPKMARRALALSQSRYTYVFGMGLTWTEKPAYRGASVTTATVRFSKHRPPLELAYAITPRACLVTLKPSLLPRLIDDELAGRLPRGSARPTAAAQSHAALDLAMRPGGGLSTLLGRYLLSERAEHAAGSRLLADALFRALPGTRVSEPELRRASLAVFGFVPTTADGLAFRWSPSGAADPLRGNRHAPLHPISPVAKTPFEQALSRFVRFHVESGLDVEPGSPRKDPVQSFVAKMTLVLGK